MRLQNLITRGMLCEIGRYEDADEILYRFQQFEFVKDTQSVLELLHSTKTIHKQAVLSFNGPAYLGLDATELCEEDLIYAQDHLRILCGLYGILCPLDVIQAYRLEMGQKLGTNRSSDLYGYWGSSIAQEINSFFSSGDQTPRKVIVNVASQEYFKSVALDALDADIEVIECVFKDDGRVKSVYAKRARGLLCKYLITNRVDSIDGIQQFDLEGYEYCKSESSEKTIVFTRTAAKQKQVLKEIQAQTKAKRENSKIKGNAAQEKKRVKQVQDDRDINDDSISTKRSTRSVVKRQRS